VHLHGAVAYCNSLFGCTIHSHDGRLIYYHLVVYHDERIGGAKVNGELLFEEFKEIEQSIGLFEFVNRIGFGQKSAQNYAGFREFSFQKN